MKPVAFIVRVPLRGFSKHDAPASVAPILKGFMQNMLRSAERTQGELPFDIENVICEAEYGPQRVFAKDSSTGKGDSNGGGTPTPSDG